METAPPPPTVDPAVPREAASEPSAPLPPSLWRRALPWLLVYAALRFSFSLVALPARTPHWAVLLASLALSAAFIFLAARLLAEITRPLPAWRTVWLLLGAGGLAWFAITFGIGPAFRGPAPSLAGRAGFGLLAALADVALITLGAGIGCSVAHLIRDRNILLPAGVFAAFADYFMVRYGTVHHALQTEGGRQVVQAMSATLPAVHTSLSPVTMGMADFVFLAFFFACAARFRMNFHATFLTLTALLAALLFGIRWLSAFPAVAPMALGFVLVNLRHFRLTRAEIHATALVFILMAGLATAFVFFLRP